MCAVLPLAGLRVRRQLVRLEDQLTQVQPFTDTPGTVLLVWMNCNTGVSFCVCVFLRRDHPSVIKRRCASVLLVSALSPAVVKTWMHWADVQVCVDSVYDEERKLSSFSCRSFHPHKNRCLGP